MTRQQSELKLTMSKLLCLIRKGPMLDTWLPRCVLLIQVSADSKLQTSVDPPDPKIKQLLSLLTMIIDG